MSPWSATGTSSLPSKECMSFKGAGTATCAVEKHFGNLPPSLSLISVSLLSLLPRSCSLLTPNNLACLG